MYRCDPKEFHYSLYYVPTPHYHERGITGRLFFIRHGREGEPLPEHRPAVDLDNATEAWFRRHVWNAVYDGELGMLPATDGWVVDLPHRTIL